MRTNIHRSVAALGCLTVLLVAPTTVWAQDQAGITGLVVDETLAPLPGVTVVVASPALIEQTRTAVTDGTGTYQIIALAPGTYSVTFTLQGFNTVVREDVVLTGAFVAAVDATLPIGELSETVTVSGEAPLVDVVSVRQQTVLGANRINVLPGATSVMFAMQYVPGVTGNGFNGAGASVHGSDGADGQPHVDGIKSGMQLGSRNNFLGGIGLITDEALVAEIVFDTSAQTAEFAQSGVRTNMIPKAGGNNFSFEIFANGTNENFADDNLTDELRDQGFEFAPQAYTYSINPSAGGPIVKDKLWFFASFIENRGKNFILDTFFDPDEPSTPDGLGDDLRAFNSTVSGQQNVRITHQLTQRNKLTGNFVNHRNNFDRVVGTNFGRVAAEALFDGVSDPTYMLTGRWTAPVTNRFLVEVTAAYQRADLAFIDPPENGIGRIPLSDVASGLQSGTSILQNFYSQDHKRNIQASLAYVTGSHNFKAGLNYVNNLQYFQWQNNGDIFQGLTFNGFPIGILIMANGEVLDERNQNCDCGLYAQDSWTLDRLTLTGGVRFDWFNNSLAGGSRPAGFFSPALDADGIDDLPNWKNTNGRFGVAFDLFGDGQTALKASGGRYVANEGLGITQTFSPFGTGIDFRSWNDSNFDGNAINADGTPQFGEIGESFDPNYGTATTANRLDPDAQRGTNWEFSSGIEHQLAPGWSVSGSWHRRRFGNFRWADNTSFDASALSPLTFTSPLDSRLPGGGGEEITIFEFSDPTGAAFSEGDILTTAAPDDYRTWNGFEVVIDGELPRGGFMTGSWTTGTTVNNFCTNAREESPNSLRFCNNETGYRNLYKVSGALPLPYDTMISGIFQVFPGQQVLAGYSVNAADIGRPIVNTAQAGDGTVTVALIEPGTQYDDFTTSLQLRFAKVFTLGDVRTRVYMNANNIFNDLTLNARNQFFGGGAGLE